MLSGLIGYGSPFPHFVYFLFQQDEFRFDKLHHNVSILRLHLYNLFLLVWNNPLPETSRDHTSEKTTQIYLDELDNTTVDAANEKVAGLLKKNGARLVKKQEK